MEAGKERKSVLSNPFLDSGDEEDEHEDNSDDGSQKAQDGNPFDEAETIMLQHDHGDDAHSLLQLRVQELERQNAEYREMLYNTRLHENQWDRRGYLKKYSTNANEASEKYFRTMGVSGGRTQLVWYLSIDDLNPRGSILLTGSSIVEAVVPPNTTTSGKCLSVHYDNKTLNLLAPSRHDHEDWFSALQHLCRARPAVDLPLSIAVSPVQPISLAHAHTMEQLHTLVGNASPAASPLQPSPTVPPSAVTPIAAPSAAQASVAVHPSSTDAADAEVEDGDDDAASDDIPLSSLQDSAWDNDARSLAKAALAEKPRVSRARTTSSVRKRVMRSSTSSSSLHKIRARRQRSGTLPGRVVVRSNSQEMPQSVRSSKARARTRSVSSSLRVNVAGSVAGNTATTKSNKTPNRKTRRKSAQRNRKGRLPRRTPSKNYKTGKVSTVTPVSVRRRKKTKVRGKGRKSFQSLSRLAKDPKVRAPRPAANGGDEKLRLAWGSIAEMMTSPQKAADAQNELTDDAKYIVNGDHAGSDSGAEQTDQGTANSGSAEVSGAAANTSSGWDKFKIPPGVSKTKKKRKKKRNSEVLRSANTVVKPSKTHPKPVKGHKKIRSKRRSSVPSAVVESADEQPQPADSSAEQTSAAIKIQSVIRGFLHRVRFRRLVDLYSHSKFAKPLRRRYNVLREVVQSERVFVQGLEELVKQYTLPMRRLEEDGALPKGTTYGVFSNVEALLAVHRSFVAHLEDAVDKYPNPVFIGRLFVQLNPQLAVHGQYTINYDSAMDMLHTLHSDYPILAHNLPGGHHWLVRIASLMITPVQRIPRYVLLLKDLLACTSHDHVEYKTTHKALVAIGQTADFINETKRLSDAKNRVKVLESELSGKAQLMPVLKRGWVWKQSKTLKQWRRRYAILEGHMLFFHHKLEENMKAKGVFDLEGCTVEVLPDLAPSKTDTTVTHNRFIIRFLERRNKSLSGATELLCAADTLDDCRDWLQKMQMASSIGLQDMYKRLAVPHRRVIMEGDLGILCADSKGADLQHPDAYHCILFNDIFLYALNTPEGLVFKGVLHLTTVQLVQEVQASTQAADDTEEKSLNASCRFRVQTASNSMTFFTESPETNQKWVAQFNDCLKNFARMTQFSGNLHSREQVRAVMQEMDANLRVKKSEQRHFHVQLSQLTDRLFQVEDRVLEHDKQLEDYDSGKLVAKEAQRDLWKFALERALEEREEISAASEDVARKLAQVNVDLAQLMQFKSELEVYLGNLVRRQLKDQSV